MKTRGIMKCATCGETFGCDGPALGPQYCSEECDPESWSTSAEVARIPVVIGDDAYTVRRARPGEIPIGHVVAVDREGARPGAIPTARGRRARRT